mgnify:CR=1 FL=1
MKSITITEDEFKEVTSKVIKNFDKRKDGEPINPDANPAATMVMMLQNMVFAAELAKELFGHEE